MRVELPYPPRALNPNARKHYMALAAAKKSYRTECTWEAKAQGIKPLSWPFLGVTITMHPPRNGSDDDNAVAAFKAGRDGVADAIGIDDRLWRVKYQWGEVVKGGVVVMNFYESDGALVPYKGDKSEVKI